MIRVVAQHAPNLYAILGLFPNDAETLAPTIAINGLTYYRAESHDRWVLYKAALSGWGAAAPNPTDTRPTFDARQR